MKITSEKKNSIAVFLLLYYIYMNSVRRIMIPLSSITVPLLLAVVFAFSLLEGKVRISGSTDKAQCISWILIAVCTLLNNQSIAKNLIEGGMIQLYVMIAFMLFVTSGKDWMTKWCVYTKAFIMIHATSTVVFFFSRNIYSRFVNIFHPSGYYQLMNYYSRGWMSGLCSHFSSNGMILAIGVFFFFENALTLKKNAGNFKTLIREILCFLIVLYALVLTSKRGPLIAVFISIAIVYILREGKNVGKRLLILFVVCVAIYIAYKTLVQSIPGLATIMAKFDALENSSAGVLNGREGLWERAIELFKRNPLLGGGFGSYSVYANETDAITTSAHNYYLQVLAEQGLVGIFLYLTAFITGLSNAIGELKTATRSGADSSTIMLLCVSAEVEFFVIIYSMTSTALMYYNILVPYFLACTVVRNIHLSRKYKG